MSDESNQTADVGDDEEIPVPAHCPRCRGSRVLRVLYGDLMIDPDWPEEERDFIEAGCVELIGDAPDWHCPRCRYEWGPNKWVISNPDPDCPFCPPPTERVFYESDLALGFWDGYPLSPGHALLVPRRHVPSWEKLQPQESAALTEAISIAQAEISKDHSPNGFNIGINDGAAAGQTVPHLHLHVIPRYEGDVEDPRGGVRWIVPDKADYWSDRKE